MNKKIVLIGAGSTSFGSSMFNDIYLSDVLEGSTVVLHDINKDKLEMIYELLIAENELYDNKFNLERTVDRTKALRDADFIINSIEVGDRMDLWRQDYEIPRKYGSTQILGECGGPGGTFHSWRIIPPIVEIVKDAEKICPNAFFINFSNPMSRVCLAIKRSVEILKFVGLCHQIGFMVRHLPILFNKSIEELKMTTNGLNHFAFLIGLEDIKTGKDLMPDFDKKAMNYFKSVEHKFEFSRLTFEVYKRFGYFPYVGDNHLGEYLQFGEEFTETQDMLDWLDHVETEGEFYYNRYLKHHRRLKRGSFPKKGFLRRVPSGERAIPIIEAIINDHNSYEVALNIPNDNLVDNLPQDLVLECSAKVDKNGIHGIKVGDLPKRIVALLRIEASVQDLCVEAVLKESKEIAIASLAIDPNVGNFEMAENIFNEMIDLQKDFLPNFK
jgi:alpha-galactosidase